MAQTPLPGVRTAPASAPVAANLRTVVTNRGARSDARDTSDTASAAVTIPALSPRMQRYNNTWYALYFAGVVWNLLGLWVLLRTRLSAAVRDAVERRVRFQFVRGAVYFAAISLYLALWLLPVSAYGYALDHSFGFATSGVGLWLADRARGYLVGLSAVPAVWAGFLLLERQPRLWWLWLWALSIPWTLLQTVLWPVVVAPMYNRFAPMPAGPLRDRLVALADSAGVHGARVYVVDISRRTTKLNAYVTGLGPSKRIVLWDTTLHDLTPDEVVAITGHEMGHYVLGHVWQNFLAGVVGAFALLGVLAWMLPAAVRRSGPLFGLRGPHDLAALPLILLLLDALLFLQTPVECAISRWHEHAADRYGLAITGLRVPMARAFVKFVTHDYADPDPPGFIQFWLGTHPPLKERVEYALHFRPDPRD